MPCPHPRAALLALLLALGAPAPASASTLSLFQEWRDPLFASNGQSLTTNTHVDTTSLTGSGTELAPATTLVLIEYLFGVGQNAYSAVLTDPPDLTTTGNVAVEFSDGAVTGRLFTVLPTGSGNTQLLNLSTGTVTAVAIFGAGLVNYGTVLFLNEYVLHSTTTTVVPEPGALALAVVAALGLATRRRR